MAMGKIVLSAKRRPAGRKAKRKPRFKRGYTRSSRAVQPGQVDNIHRVPRLIQNGTFAPEVFCEMVYSDKIQFTHQNLYAYGSITFLANGMYDPDDASTAMVTGERNGQTRLMDQMQTLYDRYRVLSSSIEVTFIGKGADATGDSTCFVYTTPPSFNDTIPTLPDLVQEHPQIKSSRQYCQVGPYNGGNSRKKIKLYWSEKSLDFMDRIVNFAEDSQDPQDKTGDLAVPVQYIVGCINNDELTTGTDIDAHVRIVYKVLWSHPKYHGTSV